jgi:hypothetical protein
MNSAMDNTTSRVCDIMRVSGTILRVAPDIRVITAAFTLVSKQFAAAIPCFNLVHNTATAYWLRSFVLQAE